MKIKIAHDFTCPWCWIALFQWKALSSEFPEIEFDWAAYELWPEELSWPEPSAPKEVDPRRPVTPSRLELAYAAQGISAPTAVRPKRVRTHLAHQVVELGKDLGRRDEVLERIYRAFWEEGLHIGEAETLETLVADILPSGEVKRVLADRPYGERIVPFDDEAYSQGVFNVPTFFIEEKVLAEQPLGVLREAILAARLPQ